MSVFSCLTPRALLFSALLAALLPATSSAAEVDQGRVEAGALLDGMINAQFRRLGRVRAALYECDLDEQAAKLEPSDEEAASGAFEFSKAVFSSDSANVKAWLDAVVPGDDKRTTLATMYSLALRAYFGGVRDGASGSLIWVDDDDKKKLCTYMLKEAEDFERLRAGQ